MVQLARGFDELSVRKHLAALHKSSELTTIHRRMYQQMAIAVTPEQVIETLCAVGVECVLMGTHGLGGWRKQARATEDVDVLVRKKDIRKAVRALHEAYPELTIKDTPVVTRFLDPATGNPAIDVMKPTQPVYQMVFRYTIPVGKTHRIPDLEMALVSKFSAMVSPNRSVDKKLQDGADFFIVIKHNRQEIDMKKLKRLANKVYPDGGVEIAQIIDDIDAGRMIKL